MTVFRPCIDLHDGRVKQIVGGSLRDGETPRTNFVSDRDAAWYAALYRDRDLRGGHVILLGPGNEEAARAALKAFPGGLQVGGGINASNALEWLEDHLRRRTGSLLVASHDRAFLDATVTRIWELRDRRLTTFRGDYSAFHRQREERDARAEKEADTWEEQVVRERELIQRYRSQRKFSKMHEHEARLETLLRERRDAPRKVRKLTLPLRPKPIRSARLTHRQPKRLLLPKLRRRKQLLRQMIYSANRPPRRRRPNRPLPPKLPLRQRMPPIHSRCRPTRPPPLRDRRLPARQSTPPIRSARPRRKR